MSADANGAVRSEVLGASFATVGSWLRISWNDGSDDI